MILQSLITHLVLKFPSLIDLFSLEPERVVSDDRVILEETILPYFAQSVSANKVLFVGCAAYTRRYKDVFGTKEYWTIDPKRVKRKYGSQRHIVDSIAHIDRHVVKNYFDLIIMNGVIGFGLNARRDIERAIEACFEVLVSQGILLVGWNDTAGRAPVDIRAIPAIGQFCEYYFEPLQACHYRTTGWQQHTYSFYQKA